MCTSQKLSSKPSPCPDPTSAEKAGLPALRYTPVTVCSRLWHADVNVNVNVLAFVRVS